MNVLPVVYIICSPRKKSAPIHPMGTVKIYTPGSIAYSQRMLTEISKSGAIAKVRILVESDTVKYLKY